MKFPYLKKRLSLKNVWENNNQGTFTLKIFLSILMVKVSLTKVTPMTRPELKARECRKPGEGLKPDCVAKFSKIW